MCFCRRRVVAVSVTVQTMTSKYAISPIIPGRLYLTGLSGVHKLKELQPNLHIDIIVSVVDFKIDILKHHPEVQSVVYNASDIYGDNIDSHFESFLHLMNDNPNKTI